MDSGRDFLIRDFFAFVIFFVRRVCPRFFIWVGGEFWTEI
jgi:hypothetical protein